MPITIVNVRDHGGLYGAKRKGFVYIGRGSPLGNPYSHLEGSKALYLVPTREEAIAAYRSWLFARLRRRDRKVIKALEDIKPDSVLACFCVPLACHGTVVAAAWDWWMNKGGRDAA